MTIEMICPGFIDCRVHKHIGGGIWVLLALIGWTGGAAVHAQESPKAFAFVGAPYVITAEVSGAHQFVLNLINLSEYVIVAQASEFIYKGSSGQFYIGQVFDLPTKGTKGDSYRYSASILVNNSSFKGLNVIGAFHEQDHIEELSVRIGAKRFYLQPLDKGQFAQFSTKVEDLDLSNTNAQSALRNAGLTDLGVVKTTDGTSDWDRDWQNQLRPDGVNPPRHLEAPEVTATEDARRSNTYGKVRLSATITRDGTIQDLVVVKGLGHGLDERALEAVKTSWIFLPATRNGEVVEAKIQFDVTFAPPKK
jgi:TonB family protein